MLLFFFQFKTILFLKQQVKEKSDCKMYIDDNFYFHNISLDIGFKGKPRHHARLVFGFLFSLQYVFLF